MNVDIIAIFLLFFAFLGLISNNSAVSIAAIVLLLIRITNVHQLFPWLEQYGLSVGIIILTIGIMAPLASGSLSLDTTLRSFFHWKSLLAVLVGMLVAYLGGRGVSLMGSQPTIIAGLLIGTVLGVALFRGVAVGPLIAAGILSLIIGKS